MDSQNILDIAEGLRLIEEGVTKIQDGMRGAKVKSIREMAEELIPVLGEDDAIRRSILQKLE